MNLIQEPMFSDLTVFIIAMRTTPAPFQMAVVISQNFTLDLREPVQLPADPTPPIGFEFSGWYLDSAFTQPFIVGQVFGDITLHARFIAIVYTITYHLNNGSFQASPVLTFTIESPNITLPTPSRYGYDFGGWFVNAGFTGVAVTQIPTGSINNREFFARWTPTVFNITYNLNGGFFGSTAPETFTIESAAITLPHPQRTGFNFDGWFNNSAFTGEQLTQIPSNSTGHRAFYARWIAIEYTIVFGVNGGTISTTIPDIFTIESETIVLPVPTRAGHTFLGWFTNPTRTGSAVTQITNGSIGDRRFYAGWEIHRFTVTFVVSGEIFKQLTVDWGTVLGAVIFTDTQTQAELGLYVNALMSSSFDIDSPIKSIMTLYAPSPFSIDVTLSFNDRGETTTRIIPFNEFIGHLPTLQRTGYVFEGWFYNSAGTLPVQPSDRLTTNTTVFAVWSPAVIEEPPVPTRWELNRGWAIPVIVVGSIILVVVVAVLLIKAKKNGNSNKSYKRGKR
ncbi:MAG: InlB B-repeat-containing protein [Firmicutes bacterium]|nr:InlB B-repeat-containing protein [Bacillota bacterium]